MREPAGLGSGEHSAESSEAFEQMAEEEAKRPVAGLRGPVETVGGSQGHEVERPLDLLVDLRLESTGEL